MPNYSEDYELHLSYVKPQAKERIELQNKKVFHTFNTGTYKTKQELNQINFILIVQRFHSMKRHGKKQYKKRGGYFIFVHTANSKTAWYVPFQLQCENSALPDQICQ